MSKHREQRKEPVIEQIASFVWFFVLLLVFKGFFLPLFIIPTGSMAETLCGAHGTRTCPNCGFVYQVGFQPPGGPQPAEIQCPNCRWREPFSGEVARDVRRTIGDRITVLSWPYDLAVPALGPKHWDVVVFRNPQDSEENYIKRLIGLPGEKVEIIDGDVFINDEILRKPAHVQETLWFPYFDADYVPRRAGGRGETYRPRWTAVADAEGWSGLDGRVFTYRGGWSARRETEPGVLQFVNTPGGDRGAVGIVQDVYGYNPTALWFGPGQRRDVDDYVAVSDVRLSAQVEIVDGDGHVELTTTKADDRLVARLHADGRLELLRTALDGSNEELWGARQVRRGRPVALALANADRRVIVTVDGAAVLTSPATYTVSAAEARAQASRAPRAPVLRIGAVDVLATVARVRIDRDIYYRSDLQTADGRYGHGTQGRAYQLRDAEYFVLGDNSPNSADSRAWMQVGPHLRATDFHLGAVPADQMIGRAFFVYWPGFLPMPWSGPSIVPNFGRTRWIY